MKKVTISIPFELSYGKFKEVRGYENEVEFVEQCNICNNDDLWHEKCYYLSNNKYELYFQICKECFKKLKVKKEKLT